MKKILFFIVIAFYTNLGFGQNMSEFYRKIRENLILYQDCDCFQNLLQNNCEGKMIIEFMINENGSAFEVKILECQECYNFEKLKAIIVATKWKYDSKQSHFKKQKIIIPITICLRR